MTYRSIVAALVLATSAGLTSAQTINPTPSLATSTDEADKLTTVDKMKMLDVNRDGSISRTEADSALQKDWARWDTNKDGRIDGPEYLAGSKLKAEGTTLK